MGERPRLWELHEHPCMQGWWSEFKLNGCMKIQCHPLSSNLVSSHLWCKLRDISLHTRESCFICLYKSMVWARREPDFSVLLRGQKLRHHAVQTYAKEAVPSSGWPQIIKRHHDFEHMEAGLSEWTTLAPSSSKRSQQIGKWIANWLWKPLHTEHSDICAVCLTALVHFSHHTQIWPDSLLVDKQTNKQRVLPKNLEGVFRLPETFPSYFFYCLTISSSLIRKFVKSTDPLQPPGASSSYCCWVLSSPRWHWNEGVDISTDSLTSAAWPFASHVG